MLPKDPYILMSYVNQKLRDEYADLDALCENREIDREELERRLTEAGFVYDEEQKRFR
jgi:hypothetical protein